MDVLFEWTFPKGSQLRIVEPFLGPTAMQEKSWLKLHDWAALVSGVRTWEGTDEEVGMTLGV